MTSKQITGINENDVQTYGLTIEEIDNEAVNLMFVGIDGSASMGAFENDMRGSLKEFKDGLTNSKEADIILVARADFRDDVIDVGAYEEIKDFRVDFKTDGQTPLYDVIVEGTDRLVAYMNQLKRGGMRVKAVFAIFSDGADNNSKHVFADARQKIEELNAMEITTAFISFGQGAKGIAQDLKFQNELPVGSSASELRKAFKCLSKSVIESSKSVASDGTNFFKI